MSSGPSVPVKRHMGTDWKSDDIDGKRYTAQEISARIPRGSSSGTRRPTSARP